MILRQIQLSLSVLILFGCIGGSFAIEQVSTTHYQQLTDKSTSSTDTNSLTDLNKLIVRGQLGRAEDVIRKHLGKYPKDADYLILLARIQQQTGRKAAAIRTLKTARILAPDYEDVYLLEAALLSSLERGDACRELQTLRDDYGKYTGKKHQENFDSIVNSSKRGINQLEVAAEYDELSNNRGVWQALSISNRIATCSGSNVYAGYNRVNRYNRSDEEVFVGAGVKAGVAGLELEYRESREVDILAKQAWSGILSFNTGLSADLLLLGSRNKYDGIETRGTGIGIDYYFLNYQFLLIGEEVAYLRENIELDSAITRRYYLGYYFDKKKYIRLGYITGKELDNDGSPSPPYSKIRTVLLSALFPLTAQTGVFIELKRHHQSGYYEQYGIRVAIRYSYW